MSSPSNEPLDEIDDPVANGPEDDGHFHFTATKTQTQRIDQFLTNRISYLSRSAVQKLIDEGLVKVNGKVTKASYKLKDGDTVDMVAPPEPVNELVPENIPLEIIYEDDYFLALNKQADMIVHPARGKMDGNAGQRVGLLRQKVEHNQRRLAAGHSASAGSQHHGRDAGGQVR